MEIQEEVKSIIEQSFDGSRLVVNEDLPSEKLSGFLIWDGFSGMDHVDRQKKLWVVLRKRLGSHATQISTIFTYTSREYEAMIAA